MPENKKDLRQEIENRTKNKGRLRQNYEVIKLLFKFIMENKKWCLIPFVLILILFVLFVLFVGNGSVMPLLYAM